MCCLLSLLRWPLSLSKPISNKSQQEWLKYHPALSTLGLMRYSLSLLLSNTISNAYYPMNHPTLSSFGILKCSLTFDYTIIFNAYCPMNHPTLPSVGLLSCSLSFIFYNSFYAYCPINYPTLSSLGLLRCSLSGRTASSLTIVSRFCKKVVLMTLLMLVSKLTVSVIAMMTDDDSDCDGVTK